MARRSPRLAKKFTESASGEVVGLFTASRSAAPMVSCDQVTLLAGEGIAGDRYATKLGSYSALKFSSREPGTREPGRQLTIISADGIESALERAGLPPTSASFGEFRRNIVVRGITGEQLLMAQGSALRLGSGVVFVHRHCVPCMYNERLCGRQGQLEAIFDVSGVSCEVLQGGVVAVGDAVCPEPADSPAHATVRDLGSQPPGYFVRPSKRTAGMLRGASLHMAGTLERVMKDDPDGAVRVEAAYESVGLRFWPASSWDAAAVLRRRRQRRQSLAACAAIAVALAAAGVAAMAVGVIAMKLQGDV